MTAAPRKGRKVSFEAAATAPEADPWSQISTLRFVIDPPYGGELLVDFTGLQPRGLALAFARGLFLRMQAGRAEQARHRQRNRAQPECA